MLGSAIKELVVVKMDEHTPYGPHVDAQGQPDRLLAGGDRVSEVKPIYDYINQTLHAAANEVLLLVPVHKLYSEEPAPENIHCVADEDDNHIGIIPLPGRFLRLHTLQMQGWTKPVHEAIHEGHPDYVKQFNRWNRGTKQKPVVTISGLGWTGMVSEGGEPFRSNESEHELHYYSVDPDGHQVKVFKWIPIFDEGIYYDDGVAEAIALNCARKIYEIYGNIEQAGLMKTEMDSVIETLRQ